MKKEEAEFMERMLDTNAALRHENYRMRVFMKSLRDPDMYGHAVSEEVRKAALALLRNEDAQRG